MEENDREQPIVEPTNALNKENDERVVSEIGSQKTDLGKFKSVEALLDAYNNLQSEFTKKCQLLSSMEKDKTEQEKIEIREQQEKVGEEKDLSAENDYEKQIKIDEQNLALFLSNNSEANFYADEI